MYNERNKSLSNLIRNEWKLSVEILQVLSHFILTDVHISYIPGQHCHYTRYELHPICEY